MNGLALEADLLRGQKTGVYLDQRENYTAAAKHARGRVLDCFTSTGGFALHAAARAEAVEAIDSSAAALATAEANARANGIGNVQFRQADVFEFLAGIDRRYSMVVLDPAGVRQVEEGGGGCGARLQGNQSARTAAAGPGGVLVTCSCSHHLSEAALLEIVAEAALDAAKTLRVLERRTQAADHPILLTVPETGSLHCTALSPRPCLAP